MLICPVASHRDMLTKLAAVLPPHPIVLGTAFGQGGFDWHARHVLRGHPRAANVTLFALKHYPFLCKAGEYGQRVTLFGRFPDMRAAISPYREQNIDTATTLLSAIFHKPFTPLADFIVVSMGTTNQMLHPSICYQLFKGWRPGQVYKERKMFYRAVDTDAVECLYDMCIIEIPTLSWALDGALKRNGRLRQQMTYEPFSAVRASKGWDWEQRGEVANGGPTGPNVRR
jgi:hypothetical protein